MAVKDREIVLAEMKCGAPPLIKLQWQIGFPSIMASQRSSPAPMQRPEGFQIGTTKRRAITYVHLDT